MIGEEVDQYKRMNDLATPTAVIALLFNNDLTKP